MSETFVSLFGDQLLSKTGEVPTDKILSGNTVGIYFSAHWCPPCRTFTPQLVNTYNKLVDKGFKIVFVSSDNDQAGFDEYYDTMPWLALPWADREKKGILSSKFKVSGIPTLIILDADAKVITKDGRSQVDADSEGEGFPWVPPLVCDVIGCKFIDNSSNTVMLDSLAGKYIGIYFSAHWCPPCKSFTPKLATLYNKIKESRNFEIIFASSDKDQEAFDEYFKEMPWLAIPYEDRERKTALSQKFNVTGIPCLVILDPSLNIVNSNARLRASSDEEGVDFPWGPKSLITLDDDPANINEYPSILYVKVGDVDPDPIRAELIRLGEHYLKKSIENNLDQEFMFFWSGDQNGRISSQLLLAMDLGEITQSLLILVDIPSGGLFYVSQETRKEDVQGLLDKYNEKDSKAQMKQMQ